MPYIPPTTHITLFATLKRERLLPMPGEVLVHEAQHVEATDVVARATIAEEHRLLDVARELGVPNDKADQYIVKNNGEVVKKGEALAVRKMALGLVPRPVRSPVDGMLVVAGEGKALLAVVSQPFELRAGLPGSINRVIDTRGVILEMTGALLQGVWGNSSPDSLFAKEAFAVMRVVGSTRTDALLPDHIDVSLRGTILVAGTLPDDTAFRKLADVRVRGLVLGSLKSELIPLILKLDLPVVVTDGFGQQGFSPAAYSLLVSNTGREVWLNARTWDRFAGERPEVIIPLPAPGQTPPNLVEGEPLANGKRVRIVRGPEAGRVGMVVALSERTETIPSGLRTRVATVEFDQHEIPAVKVAFANLEIIE
ncbi:MAG: hypothetical protein ACRDH2_03205 [Anaerolineales bacterium]